MKTTNRIGLLFGLFLMGCAMTAATWEQVNTTYPQTLTNKTLTAPVISTIVNGGTLTLPTSTDTLVGRATTDTLTNKMLSSPQIASPLYSGTTSGVHTYNLSTLAGTALGTYTLAGTPTITAPAISSPVLSGSATGTYTLAGTPTINSPGISNPAFSGTLIGNYMISGTPTVGAHLLFVDSTYDIGASGATRPRNIYLSGDISALGNLNADAGATINGPLDISGAAAGQISFPATRNASVDVNTLDDYQEGTWTPAVGGTATYGTRLGVYTKIGNMCHIEGYLQINLIGTGSQHTISGVPCGVSAAMGVNTPATIGYYVSLATNVVELKGLVNSAGSTVILLYASAAAGTGVTQLNVLGNSTNLYFSATYRTDD